MDGLEKFNENPLPEKDTTDAGYVHAKTVCIDFEIINLGEYYAFYVQSDTLLLADVCENFRNMCLEIDELGQELILK